MSSDTPRMSVREILEEAPCVQCDGSGAIQTGEDDFEQCQFCYQLRFPFIADALAALEALLNEREVAGRIDELKHCLPMSAWLTNPNDDTEHTTVKRRIAELSGRSKEESE